MSGHAGAVTERDNLSEDHFGLEKKQHEFIAEFGDLSDESARVFMVKAMIVNHAFPRFDLDGYAFERGVARLPNSTMRDVIATFAEALEADGKQARLLVQGFEISRVAEDVL